MKVLPEVAKKLQDEIVHGAVKYSAPSLSIVSWQREMPGGLVAVAEVVAPAEVWSAIVYKEVSDGEKRMDRAFRPAERLGEFVTAEKAFEVARARCVELQRS